MKLYIKQHLFTWGDTFSVYDADGSECFRVESEILTLGRKLHVYDAAGQERAFIGQELLTFLPRYHVEIDGAEVAAVVQEFTFFTREYTVEGPGWTVTGDFFDHDYQITYGCRTVDAISREWLTLGDAYEIDIAAEDDTLTALAVVIVIDACMDR